MASQARRAAPKRSAPASKRPLSTRKRRWRTVKRVLLGLTITTLALLLVAIIGGIVMYKRTNIPDPNSAFGTQTTFIYYNDGKTKLGSLAIQNRQSIPYTEMPQNIKDAVVAAENRTFWTDRGISPTGIARSLWAIATGKEIQGGSTITQQYVKIYYLSSDQTISRKLRELILAIKINKQQPKEQILGDYLNTVYFGRGAYGIQAASKSYFNVDAKNLTVAQAAVLASVLNNPSLFDPSEGDDNAERLLARYQYTLDGMLEMGTITQAQHDAIYSSLPKFPEIPLNSRYGGPKGFLIKMVEAELKAAGFSDAQIQGGGLKIITTFDAQMQAAAVATAQKYTALVAKNNRANPDPKQLHIAISSVEVGTGEVLAVYGGPDYVANSRNWATTPRPAASTFKAYAAVAGLRNDFSLRSSFNGNTFTPDGDKVPVRNEFSYQYGPVSLLKATAQSINTAFVDMTSQIPSGPTEVIKAANDAGVPKGPGWDQNDRISLGTAEVSPLANAGGFATLAANGMRNANHVVRQVLDPAGKMLIDNTTRKGTQTIDEDVCRDMTYALASVVNQGTGGAVRKLGYDIAGKTGTSGIEDKITSAWFVAYTKQISTSVMYVVGDAGNGDLDPYKRRGDGTFFGGTYPALTWADYMQVALKGLPNQPFDPPAWVNTSAPVQPPAPEVTITDTPTVPETTQPTEPPATETQPPASVPPTEQPSVPPVTEPPATSAPPVEPPPSQPPSAEPTS